MRVCRQRQELNSATSRGSITKAVVGCIKQKLATYIKQMLEEANALVQAAGDTAQPKAVELVPQLIA
jgi:hypothetical protein